MLPPSKLSGDESESENELVMDNSETMSLCGSGSEMDDSTDKKRQEALDKMAVIEKEFAELKERLYHEKLTQISMELDQIENSCHPGLLAEALELDQSREVRIRQAELYRKYQMENVNNLYHSEKMEAEHEYQQRKKSLHDSKYQDLIEKKKKLEEEKETLDLTGEVGAGGANEARQTVTRKLRRRNDGAGDASGANGKKRKVATVEAPHIVYNLAEEEILDDLFALRVTTNLGGKGAKNRNAHLQNHHQQNAKLKNNLNSASPVSENSANFTDPHNAYFEEGKLFYEKRLFQRGDQIYIENKESGRYSGVITAINTGEVWVRRSDGSKTKLYISQLRLGKYTVKHVKSV
eukprot:Sdes_comp22369_c0_seq1m20843